MTEERKYAVVLAATMLSAPQVGNSRNDGANPGENLRTTRFEQAKFILQRIDERWPTN